LSDSWSRAQELEREGRIDEAIEALRTAIGPTAGYWEAQVSSLFQQRAKRLRAEGDVLAAAEAARQAIEWSRRYAGGASSGSEGLMLSHQARQTEKRMRDCLTGSVRVWSPLTVGVYAFFLAYPASLALAIRNWLALGQRNRVRPHLAAAVALSVPLIMLLLRSPRVGRFVALGANFTAFSYLKAKLASDLKEYRNAHPEVPVDMRAWYSGIGWAILGFAMFLALVFATLTALDIVGFDV
jgi:hypothetical protein